MSNVKSMSNDKNQKYDLAERTAKFGEDIVEFIKELSPTNINQPLINQIIRSATSIGANYMEADGAESKKDFKHKIGICKKEAKETLIFSAIINLSKSWYFLAFKHLKFDIDLTFVIWHLILTNLHVRNKTRKFI